MQLVLLGMPGAGKGTFGGRIAEKYRIPHISTGGIIREAVASGLDLGRQVTAYATRGDLVPDGLMIQIVSERLKKPDCTKGWILDGFPRTVRQAGALDWLLADCGAQPLALEIRVSQKEALERITQRRVCSQCGAVYNLRHYPEGKALCDACGGTLYRRVDDHEDTVRKRLLVYLRQTHPVVHYYAQKGKLLSVEGKGTIDQIFAKIDGLLQGLGSINGERP